MITIRREWASECSSIRLQSINQKEMKRRGKSVVLINQTQARPNFSSTQLINDSPDPDSELSAYYYLCFTPINTQPSESGISFL